MTTDQHQRLMAMRTAILQQNTRAAEGGRSPRPTHRRDHAGRRRDERTEAALRRAAQRAQRGQQPADASRTR